MKKKSLKDKEATRSKGNTLIGIPKGTSHQ